MPSLVVYSTVTSPAAARLNVTVNATPAPSVAVASSIVSAGSAGVSVISADAGPSSSPAFVAFTRTVYAVSLARPVIVRVVVDPDPTTASRSSSAASANVSPPERHCTRYPSAPVTAVQSTFNWPDPGVSATPATRPSARVTVTVYVSVLFPSSAVTSTSMVFAPTDSATW